MRVLLLLAVAALAAAVPADVCIDPDGKLVNRGESYTAADGCNTCTCNPDGPDACTLMLCPTCTGRDGKEYPKGAWYPTQRDTCNRCQCDPGSEMEACTRMYCGRSKRTSEPMCEGRDGEFYPKGVWYPTKKDTCNRCQCDPGSEFEACTRMACRSKRTSPLMCEGRDGKMYPKGVWYPTKKDTCNRCLCDPGSEMEACTRKWCPRSKRTSEPMCEGRDGKLYPKGVWYPSKMDTCNSCQCDPGSEFEACTRMGCRSKRTSPPMCEGRDGKMYPKGVWYPTKKDTCNRCRCDPDSEFQACTLMLCPDKRDTPTRPGAPGTARCKGDDGNYYKPGQSYTALDGCNTCFCNPDGPDGCTLMLCPDKRTSPPWRTRCMGADGRFYKHGESYPAFDGCNRCTCNIYGPEACTMMACPPKESGCRVGDIFYSPGQSFTAADGCNSCTCGQNGEAFCTKMLCPEPPQ